MNFQEPFRIHQIDFNNITYTKIKSSDVKKIIFIKYTENKKQKPFVIQCPTLLNINEAIKVSNDYHELEMPIITQVKEKSKELFNFFEELDGKIMSDAKIYSKLWFDNLSKEDGIRYKKVIRESDNFSEGILRLKLIKNIDFETLLQVDNKKRINVKEIPKDSWCKMLIEIYAVVVNYQNNTFSLFLRPIILSFKEKQSVNYNYKFLESDSDSNSDKEDIPDSELSGIFMKQREKQVDKNDLTSSAIKYVGEKQEQEQEQEQENKVSSSSKSLSSDASDSSESSTEENFKKLATSPEMNDSEKSKKSSDSEKLNDSEKSKKSSDSEKSKKSSDSEKLNDSEKSKKSSDSEKLNDSDKSKKSSYSEKSKKSSNSESSELHSELSTSSSSEKIKLTDSSDENIK
jgi:hypothetical protein